MQFYRHKSEYAYPRNKTVLFLGADKWKCNPNQLLEKISFMHKGKLIFILFLVWSMWFTCKWLLWAWKGNFAPLIMTTTGQTVGVITPLTVWWHWWISVASRVSRQAAFRSRILVSRADTAVTSMLCADQEKASSSPVNAPLVSLEMDAIVKVTHAMF